VLFNISSALRRQCKVIS